MKDMNQRNLVFKINKNKSRYNSKKKKKFIKATRENDTNMYTKRNNNKRNSKFLISNKQEKDCLTTSSKCSEKIT